MYRCSTQNVVNLIVYGTIKLTVRSSSDTSWYLVTVSRSGGVYFTYDL